MNGRDSNTESDARGESQRADRTLKSVLLMHSKTSAGVLDCCGHQEATERRGGIREEKSIKTSIMHREVAGGETWLISFRLNDDEQVTVNESG